MQYSYTCAILHLIGNEYVSGETTVKFVFATLPIRVYFKIKEYPCLPYPVFQQSYNKIGD